MTNTERAQLNTAKINEVLALVNEYRTGCAVVARSDKFSTIIHAKGRLGPLKTGVRKIINGGIIENVSGGVLITIYNGNVVPA